MEEYLLNALKEIDNLLVSGESDPKKMADMLKEAAWMAQGAIESYYKYKND